MKPSNLKASVKAGFARYYFDGVTEWSKKGIEGLINPRGYSNSLNDPEIIAMFKEFESEGLIEVFDNDEIFLRVLKSS